MQPKFTLFNSVVNTETSKTKWGPNIFKPWFWSIKVFGEVLSKLKCRGFRATSLSTYDFSTLYTTLPHNLIKEKIQRYDRVALKKTIKIYGSLYLACNDRKAFFTSCDQSRYALWSWSVKFTHLNYSGIKPTPQIPKPLFGFSSFYCKWICFF